MIKTASNLLQVGCSVDFRPVLDRRHAMVLRVDKLSQVAGRPFGPPFWAAGSLPAARTKGNVLHNALIRVSWASRTI